MFAQTRQRSHELTQKAQKKGANSLACVNKKTPLASLPSMNFLGSLDEIHSA
jgi:hypothetical protein